jgi:gamma-glutamylcyclotransferase (GGCT)/AIG2-like uncharacterized protein YtfP
MSNLLFVYGTLKRGHQRSSLLQDQRFIGVANTLPIYKIFQYRGYPALIPCDEGNRIYGELYEVSDSCIIDVDRVECVHEGLFVRKDIKIENYNLFSLPIHKESSLKLFSNIAFSYHFVDVERLSKLKDCGNNWTIN